MTRRMGIEHLDVFAYLVSITTSRRVYDVAVARRVRLGDGETTTVVVVRGPGPLRGSYVRIVETPSPASLSIHLKLPPMPEPVPVAPEYQLESMPLVDIGYLDFIAYRHPALVGTDRDGHPVSMLRSGDVLVEEVVDPLGRVRRRTVRRPGVPPRTWRCEFPGAGAEQHLASSGTVDVGDRTDVVRFSRPGPAFEVPAGWLDDPLDLLLPGLDSHRTTRDHGPGDRVRAAGA